MALASASADNRSGRVGLSGDDQRNGHSIDESRRRLRPCGEC